LSTNQVHEKNTNIFSTMHGVRGGSIGEHSSSACIWIIYLSVDPDLWFPSRFSWYRVAANRGATKQGFLLAKFKSSLRMFNGRHHDLVNRYGTSVTNDHRCVSLVRSFPHSWLITGFVTRLTRRVPLVEQKLLTLPVCTWVSSPGF